MKELFLLLFFGKSLLLTPAPITIGPSCSVLQPDKTLHVVNGGAALEIRLKPGSNTTSKTINPVSASSDLGAAFPVGTVTAQLDRKDGSRVIAVNSDVGTGADFYELNLRPPVPLGSPKGLLPAYRDGDSFISVTICSKSPIINAQVYWQTATE